MFVFKKLSQKKTYIKFRINMDSFKIKIYVF